MEPLQKAAVPGHPGIWVLGCLERNVSIYLQQVRALNLAWALTQDKKVHAGSRVLVVGGGFAGMTVAAGLAVRGARVTLLEQGKELLGYQRHNQTRFIHPHVHEWPLPGSLEEGAGLPLLDWNAGLAGDVAATLLAQWNALQRRSALTVITGSATPSLEPAGAQTLARPAGGEPLPSDAVVLALGLGVERSFANLPLNSYWMDDQISREQQEARRTHLVSGVGEGGVIDALYLCLSAFSHAAVAQGLAQLPGMAQVRQAVLAVEQQVALLPEDQRAAALSQGFRQLPVPAGADAWLKGQVRSDTEVILNGPDAHPLSPKADPLNRFLISRLLHLGALRFLSGAVTSVEPRAGGYDVTVAGMGTTRVDQVHIRHGTVPALKTAYPALWEPFHTHRLTQPFDAPVPAWPTGFFSD